MIEIERYNGKEEFSKLLKTMPIIPSNTEIVEKTGVSKGSVSEIMNGKRTPTKNFIDKFKKGFHLEQQETKNPPPEEEADKYTLLYKIIDIQAKQIEVLQELLLKK